MSPCGLDRQVGAKHEDLTFAIFDAFPDEDARRAHLSGQVAGTSRGGLPHTVAGTLRG